MSRSTVVVGILIIATLTIGTTTTNANAASHTQDNLQAEEQQAKSLIDRCSALLANATISTQSELNRCDSQILDLSNNACGLFSPNAVAEMVKGPICNDPRLNNYITVRNLWDKIG